MLRTKISKYVLENTRYKYPLPSMVLMYTTERTYKVAIDKENKISFFLLFLAKNYVEGALGS